MWKWQLHWVKQFTQNLRNVIIATVQSQQDNPSLSESDNAAESGSNGGGNGVSNLEVNGNVPFDNFNNAKNGDLNDFEKFKVNNCFSQSLILII